VESIKQQLPSRYKVSSALDRRISTNKLALTLLIAYYVDQNWAVLEVQVACDKVECPVLSNFDSSLRITVVGKHTEAHLVYHWKEVLDH
jgi:hypothetical protein